MSKRANYHKRMLVYDVSISISLLILASCSVRNNYETPTTPHQLSSPVASFTLTPDLTSQVASMTASPSPETRTATPITHTPTNTSIPTITSPASTLEPMLLSNLAVISQERGVEIIEPNGENRVQITQPCFFCYSVSWSPDGGQLAFDAAFERFSPNGIFISSFHLAGPAMEYPFLSILSSCVTSAKPPGTNKYFFST